VKHRTTGDGRERRGRERLTGADSTDDDESSGWLGEDDDNVAAAGATTRG